MTRYLLCALMLMAVPGLAMAPALAADCGNPNPGVMPPTATVGGLGYSQWADRYNQWLFSLPYSADLLADAGLGQDSRSSVFFLPSAYGAGTPPFTLQGQITVAADRHLLLPVTWAFVAGPTSFGCCWVTDEQASGCMPDVAGPILDSLLSPLVPSLYASVDGTSLQITSEYRVRSTTPYVVSMPADNVFTGLEVPCGVAFTGRGMSDGYWLMLTPLSPGQHTITFGSSVLHTTLYVTVPSDG